MRKEKRLRKIYNKILDVFPEYKKYRVKCYKSVRGLISFVAKASSSTYDSVKYCYSESNLKYPKSKYIKEERGVLDDYRDIFMISGNPILVNLKHLSYASDETIFFSLLHEIGHVELGHTEANSNAEKEADRFASKKMRILKRRLKNCRV